MASRIQPSVLWREGMFLFPQHLQAFAREVQSRLHASGSLGLIGNWGLLELDVDPDALAADAFAIRKATVVFRDGSLGTFPGNAAVERREFAEHFTGPELDVYLGVPAAQAGVPQIGEDDGRVHRYRVLRDEVHDENDREARRELEFRELQGRIFFGDEDRSGFDSVPIARLERVGEPRTRAVLSQRYIPPVLRTGASPVLFSALQRLAAKARAQSRDLAARMPDVQRLSSAERGSDILGLFKLQAVNQCVSLLEHAAGQEEQHPFDAYMALVQTVGSLAVFGAERVVPELPAYEHGDQDRCFRATLDAVDALLGAEVAAPYDVVAFAPDPLRHGLFRSDLPNEWVDRDAIFHLAVEMAEDADTIREMVAAGVKLLPEADIERVLQGVMPGIEVRHERVPPLSFPKRDTLHYFAVETEGAGRDAWLRVLKSRSAVVLSAIGSPDEVSFHFYVEFPE
jgi:type VI secretion system protein ImpJ